MKVVNSQLNRLSTLRFAKRALPAGNDEDEEGEAGQGQEPDQGRQDVAEGATSTEEGAADKRTRSGTPDESDDEESLKVYRPIKQERAD